jgi:hypothetical protein
VPGTPNSLTPPDRLKLPPASDHRNLVPFPHLPHTRFTYHRTWETGLGVEIRVATVSPDFFASRLNLINPAALLQLCIL